MKNEPANVIPPGPGPRCPKCGESNPDLVMCNSCGEKSAFAAFFPVAAPSAPLPISEEAAFLFDLLAGEGFFDVADWTVGEREDCLCILAKFFASRPAPVAPLDAQVRIVEMKPPSAPDTYAVFIGKMFVWDFEYEHEAKELMGNLIDSLRRSGAQKEQK